MKGQVSDARVVNNPALYEPLLSQSNSGFQSTGVLSNEPSAVSFQKAEVPSFGQRILRLISSSAEPRSSPSETGPAIQSPLTARQLRSVYESTGDYGVYVSRDIGPSVMKFNKQTSQFLQAARCVESKVMPQGFRTSWMEPETQQLNDVKNKADLLIQEVRSSASSLGENPSANQLMNFGSQAENSSLTLTRYMEELKQLSNSL